jgi:hypothetical protein
VVEARVYGGADEAARQRIDFLIYGPPTEDDWLEDPRALAAQNRLMAMAPGGEAGEAL